MQRQCTFGMFSESLVSLSQSSSSKRAKKAQLLLAVLSSICPPILPLSLFSSVPDAVLLRLAFECK